MVVMFMSWYDRCVAEDARAEGIERLRAGALGDDLSFLLARANALSLSAGNAALRPFGLKARSYSVLVLSAEEPGPSQRELAEFLRLDPSQIVALVDDLQSRGLLERQPAPADRRTNVVAATSAGRALLRRAQRAARAAEQTVHAGVTDDERMLLAEALRRIAFLD